MINQSSILDLSQNKKKHETWNKKHENFEKRCSLGREQGRDLKCIHSKISIALYFMILNRMFCEFWLQNAVRNVVLPTHTPNPHVPCPSSLHSFQISKPFLPTSASICLIIISSTAIDVCDHLNDDKGSTMMRIQSVRGNVICSPKAGRQISRTSS